MFEAPLRLAPSVREAMIAHARRAAPREAVGLLGGVPSGEIVAVRELPNLAGPMAFFADPHAQFLAEKSLQAAGLRVAGYYHSHPGGGIDLSPDDLHFARRADWVYVVVAVGFAVDGDVQIGVWRRSPQGRMVEVPLVQAAQP